jgi:antitoxin component of RelBE/YafQ-DinJ toxin-antitoxin module
LKCNTVFAKTVVREKRIPFEIGISNYDTFMAMKETDKILSDPSKAKGYTDVHQMFQEILDEE